jgi:hypothetical protein
MIVRALGAAQVIRKAKIENDARILAEKIKAKSPNMIFSKDQLALIDIWITANDPTVDRLEAIRRLVELGLKVKR